MTDKEKFHLTCNCGCKSLEFCTLDGILFVTVFENSFYSKQRDFIGDLKKIWDYHHDRLLLEIITNKKNLSALLHFLENLQLTEDKTDNNNSRLAFARNPVRVELYGQMRTKAILFGKGHRMYTLQYNAPQLKKLMRDIKYALYNTDK